MSIAARRLTLMKIKSAGFRRQCQRQELTGHCCIALFSDTAPLSCGQAFCLRRPEILGALRTEVFHAMPCTHAALTLPLREVVGYLMKRHPLPFSVFSPSFRYIIHKTFFASRNQQQNTDLLINQQSFRKNTSHHFQNDARHVHAGLPSVNVSCQ